MKAGIIRIKLSVIDLQDPAINEVNILSGAVDVLSYAPTDTRPGNRRTQQGIT